MMAASATIAILAHNQAGPGPDAEHGSALWIETRGGPLLFDTGRRAALIGGFHLPTAGRRRLDETVKALNRLAVENLIACHCIGQRATAY